MAASLYVAFWKTWQVSDCVRKFYDIFLNRQHWKVAQVFFKGMKGPAVEGVTDSLYQRHYKIQSLYICFVFIYIYHKGYNAC